jgi:hypothetical protein
LSKLITPTARLLVAITFCSAPVAAQWLNQPTPGTPRSKDGKPNLVAPAPKARDGNPDLSGIWIRTTPKRWAAGTGTNGLDVFLAEGTVIPMLPWAEALFRKRHDQDLGAGRPSAHCLPHGIPDAMVVAAPVRILQSPGLTIFLHEEFNHFREIFTDGREHPTERNPTWFGYSIGKWERDTFVVDTVGFNDQSWLDDSGHPHTDALHTTERFRRRDFGHMDLEVTIDDPKAYTRPWSVPMQLQLLADTDLIEDICENEKDAPHTDAHH